MMTTILMEERPYTLLLPLTTAASCLKRAMGPHFEWRPYISHRHNATRFISLAGELENSFFFPDPDRLR